MRCILPILAVAAAHTIPNIADSQELDSKELQEIYGFATLMCGEYTSTGSESKSASEIEEYLKAFSDSVEENGISRKEGASSSEYVGLLREQLGAEFSDVRACRLTIWEDLVSVVLDESGDAVFRSAPDRPELPDLSEKIFRYSPQEAKWFVIMGSFGDKASAERRLHEITGLGLLPSVISTNDYPNLRNGYYSVVTPVGSLQSGQEMVQIVKSQVPDAYIKSPW